MSKFRRFLAPWISSRLSLLLYHGDQFVRVSLFLFCETIFLLLNPSHKSVSTGTEFSPVNGEKIQNFPRRLSVPLNKSEVHAAYLRTPEES